MYSNSSLTNQLSANDDSDGTLYSTIQYELIAGTTYYIKFQGYNNSAATAQLTVVPTPDWLYTTVEDVNGAEMRIYVSVDHNNNVPKAYAITNNNTIETTYVMSGGDWLLTGSYAYGGGSGPPTGVASLYEDSTVNAALFKIKFFSFNSMKQNIYNRMLAQTGLTVDSFADPEDKEYFIQGITVGLDDNILFGLYNKIRGLTKYEDEAFYLYGKLLVDSSSVVFWAVTAASSAAASHADQQEKL